jgi:hypothetical protein
MGEIVKRKPRRVDDQLRIEEPEDDRFGTKDDSEGKKKALRSIISKRRAGSRDGDFDLER